MNPGSSPFPIGNIREPELARALPYSVGKQPTSTTHPPLTDKTMNILNPLRIASLALLVALSACAVADDGSDLDESTVEASSRAHFDLWQSESGSQWFFHMVSGNGQVVLSSESYTTRAGAIGGLLSVLDNGTNEGRYEIFTGADGDRYVRLKAANGAVIAVTEGYSTLSSARRAVKSSVVSLTNYVQKWATSTGARFEVFEGADGQFYFNLYAKNGAIVLRSEGYTTKAGALNGAFATQQYGVDKAFYQVLTSADGGFYLNLRAPNNEVVATSEIYATKASAERARGSIIALLPQIELL